MSSLKEHGDELPLSLNLNKPDWLTDGCECVLTAQQFVRERVIRAQARVEQTF